MNRVPKEHWRIFLFLLICFCKQFCFWSSWGRSLTTLSVTSPGFYVSAVEVLKKHCGKGEIARNGQFLLFPQCFLPVLRTFCCFHQILNCVLLSLWVWKSLKFVVWERVKKNFARKGEKWWIPAFTPMQYFLSYKIQIPPFTLYHTIPTFNHHEKEGLWKHCGKRRKCWWPAFSPFPAMFSTYPNKNVCFKLNLFCRLQMLSIRTSLRFCRLVRS